MDDLPRDYEEIIDEYEATDDELEVWPSWNPPGHWADEALCSAADPEAWFPEHGKGTSTETRMAKAICQMCPVRLECLDYAIGRNEEWGIWGGMTFTERLAEKVRRGLAEVELVA
jgi:WhiB family redox-sensing transcriptional regulator